jgi:hypothetical protein
MIGVLCYRGIERMSPLRLSTIFLSATLAAAMLSGGSSTASAQIAADRSLLLQQNQLQSLENRLQRQQYQQQQQQYRAQDRQIAPQQRLVVPRMRPTCQLEPSGSSFVPTCP